MERAAVMGALDRFRRGKKENQEVRNAMKYGAVMGEAGRPVTDQEMMESLGINIHVIEDERLTSMLERAAFQNNGNEEGVDLNLFSLRIMTSKLIRSSWVDRIDAMIGQLEAERLVNRIELNMDEDTYEYGGTNLLDAMVKLIQTAWSDATDGRKAKLLKVTPRVFEIGMRETKKKEGVLP